MWDFKNFKKMLHKKKDIWAIELKPLIQVVPSFETVTKEIVENIKKDNHN